jgi:hypothetical protein
LYCPGAVCRYKFNDQTVELASSKQAVEDQYGRFIMNFDDCRG